MNVTVSLSDAKPLKHTYTPNLYSLEPTRNIFVALTAEEPLQASATRSPTLRVGHPAAPSLDEHTGEGSAAKRALFRLRRLDHEVHSARHPPVQFSCATSPFPHPIQVEDETTKMQITDRTNLTSLATLPTSQTPTRTPANPLRASPADSAPTPSRTQISVLRLRDHATTCHLRSRCQSATVAKENLGEKTYLGVGRHLVGLEAEDLQSFEAGRTTQGDVALAWSVTGTM